MKISLDDLWNEYLFEKCSEIESDEERKLTQRIAELHNKVNYLLNEDQQKAVEEYIGALYDIDALFVKKAFFKGCRFAVSFFTDTALNK